jgi:hypothetical protein
MGLHGGIAARDMRGQHQGHGRRLTGGLAGAHGVGVRDTPVERFQDGGLHCGGVVALQQAQQGGRDRTEVVAALGGALQQGLAGRGGLGEAIDGAVRAGLTLVGDQRLDVAVLLGAYPEFCVRGLA